MADEYKFGGIPLASTFALGSQKPLDSRLVVNTIAERDAHVTSNRAYDGMQVFVIADKITYIYKNNTWRVVLDDTLIINDTTSGGASKVLSAEQGKLLQNQLNAIKGGQLTVPVATTTKIGGIKSGSANNINEIVVAADGLATVQRVSKADILTTARTISLSNDVTGSVSFNGSKDVDIAVTIKDDSHNHIIGNVDGLQDALDLKAPLASPHLTGIPTAPTANANTNTTQLATTEFVATAINNVLESSKAMTFEGVVDSNTPLPTSNYNVGDTWVVGEAGTYSGYVCEPGDMIICVKSWVSGSASSADWRPIQTNINGAVTGPASAVNNRVAIFNGDTGKVIKDSGYTIGQSIPTVASIDWTIGNDVTTAKHGLMLAADKVKLDGIATGAEVNQLALSNIIVGSTTVAATTKTDTVELLSTNGITISATGKKIKFTGTTYQPVTQSANGLMIAADKKKLDSIAAGAEVNVQADWNVSDSASDAFIKNKPVSMKNPTAITVKAGSKSIVYDGSAAKSIDITNSDISAIPLIDSGTAGHAVMVAPDNARLVDSGYAIPAPANELAGKYLGVNNSGVYEIKAIGISEVTNLISTLATKVDKVSGTVGNVMQFGASGAVSDSGLVAGNVLQSTDRLIIQCTLD